MTKLDITKRINGLYDINDQIANVEPERLDIGGECVVGWMVGDDECFDDVGFGFDFYQYFVTTGGELYQCYYKSVDALANGDGVADFGLIDYDEVHAWRYVEEFVDDYDQETDDLIPYGVRYWSDPCYDFDIQVF